MRLLLRLRALDDFRYDLEYNPYIQGFIYRLLVGTEYDYLHDGRGQKFFCFSNIFPVPVSDYLVRRGDAKNLLISSPDRGFIETLYDRLRKVMEVSEVIHFNRMVFRLENVKMFSVRLPDPPFKIVSATPVVYRIYRDMYSEYGIHSDKPYLFWRPEHGLDLLERLVENDVRRKYGGFYGSEPPSTHLYDYLVPKKSVAIHYSVHGEWVQLIGTVIELVVRSPLNRGSRDVLRFILDTGLGERNPMGLGFLNIIR